jgi:DNA polymerase III gamma/tau subunit
MTDTPKVRFDNSIIADKKNNSAYDTFLAPELEAAADKAKNSKTSADPNSGAPKDPQAVEDEKKAKKEAEEKKKEGEEEKKDEKTEEKKEETKVEKKEEEKRKNSDEKKEEKKEEKKDEKKAALAQIREDPLKIPSVKGPPGAPIGFNVHALGSSAADPYAEQQSARAGEPTNGVQHQPIIMPAGFYPPPPKDAPELTYR